MSKQTKTKEQGGTIVVEREELKTPRRYKVWIYNDDVTTQEFVVDVLQIYFRKTVKEAVDLMLQVHSSGKAMIAAYPRDIAETKVYEVMQCAKQNSMPLIVTSEPE